MTNSEKFKGVFGLYVTELWAMPNEDFVKWINAEYKEIELEPPPHPEREKTIGFMNDLISRKSALEGMSFSNGLEVDGILYVPLRDVRKHLRNLQSIQPETNCSEIPNNSDIISRQDAIDALWKALYEYEDKTEKQFLESEELDVDKWMVHRIFVQNMNDIDRQTILNLPSVQPEPCDDPRADVYYLAEKIGIHRLYALVVELRGEPEMCEDQAARRLNDLIFDINPAEICSQIRSDNLRNWCETIQTEMKIAMVQLPCWAERKTDE